MSADMPRPAPWRPSRTVRALAAVSFFTDASSEIIAPLLPLFLVTSLGTSVRMVGVIEGGAETIASLLKLASGWWSDRTHRRTPLIVAGYTLASLVRPLVALATTGSQVLTIRFIDRVGKGIRGAPRDALLAESTPVESRGRAFGYHRAADHAGAVVGPLIAMACLGWLAMPVRQVFWVAAIPGALAVLVAMLFVRDVKTPPSATRVRGAATAPATPVEPALLPATFWHLLGTILLFTLGNSTDAFLLLRAHDLGVPTPLVPLLWVLLHLVKSSVSTPGGALSDRIGRAPLMISGWLLYAVVYVGFGLAQTAWHAWALFALYGMVFGLTEGTEKALVADLVPATLRGRAFGWYNAAIGIAALPASVLFGAVWDRYGASAAFWMGAALAVTASVLLAWVLRRRSGRVPAP